MRTSCEIVGKLKEEGRRIEGEERNTRGIRRSAIWRGTARWTRLPKRWEIKRGKNANNLHARRRLLAKASGWTKKPLAEVVVSRFVSAARLNIHGPLLGNAAFLARERKREEESQ